MDNNYLVNLKGKVAIVTGGNQGIGQAVSIGFAQAGATVIIFSRTDAKETLSAIDEIGGIAKHYAVDVTDESEVQSAIQDIIKRFGLIDILFNNAGICIHQDSFSIAIDDFRKVVDVNLTGEFIVAREVAKTMIDNEIPGSIINMASISADIVNLPQWQSSYGASKAAVVHLTKSLAVEWAEYGIRVNALSPGYMRTNGNMGKVIPEERFAYWRSLIPMKRFGELNELVSVVVFLASDATHYMTGSEIVLDGGYTCV